MRPGYLGVGDVPSQPASDASESESSEENVGQRRSEVRYHTLYENL